MTTPNRAFNLTESLTDKLAIAQTTWTLWPTVSPVELQLVPGETTVIAYTVKGSPVADATDDIKFKFVVSYDNGAGQDQVTHETGLLKLQEGRFHHQVLMTVTTPIAGDGKLIFTIEAWKDTNNATTFDLTMGTIEVQCIRCKMGGTCYYADDGILPGGTVLQIGDILFYTGNEVIQRWDGAQWVTIIDYSALTTPVDTASNKVGFY